MGLVGWSAGLCRRLSGTINIVSRRLSARVNRPSRSDGSTIRIKGLRWSWGKKPSAGVHSNLFHAVFPDIFDVTIRTPLTHPPTVTKFHATDCRHHFYPVVVLLRLSALPVAVVVVAPPDVLLVIVAMAHWIHLHTHTQNKK